MSLSPAKQNFVDLAISAYGKGATLDKDMVIIFLIVTYMIDSFFEFLFGANIYSFNQMIIKGNLDFILTKPINSQFLLSLRYVGLMVL